MPPSDLEFTEPTDQDPEWEQHVLTDIGSFAMIPLWFLRKGPSARAVHLMAVMLAEFGSPTKNMWPSVKTLAQMTNSSEDTVSRTFKELQTLGVLTVIHRTRPNGSKTSNAYRFDLRDPGFCGGDTAPMRHPAYRTDAVTRSISSSKKIPSGGSKISEEFKATMVERFGARFTNFDRTWRDITNSRYLNGKADQQQYVVDRLEERIERSWGTIAQPPNAQETGSLVSGQMTDDEARALGYAIAP